MGGDDGCRWPARPGGYRPPSRPQGHLRHGGGGAEQHLRDGDAPRYRQHRLQLVRLLRDKIQGGGPDLGFQAGPAVDGPPVHFTP